MPTKKDELPKEKIAAAEATDVQLVDESQPEDVLAEQETTSRTTKAGKRSAKSQREAEEAEAKQVRKEAHDNTPQGDEDATVKKGPKPVTRPKVERRGKKYRELAKQVDTTKPYAMAEALKLAVSTSPAKFDASVEVHVRLGVDPRQADQNVRSTVTLPNGTGKEVRVAVFAPSDTHAAAKKAGADVVSDDDFLAQLDKEQLNFDILIATPQFMPKLGKYARLLGPRGLMPNPKSGTVATDVTKAVNEAKAGRVEYRVDKQSIVHVAIGKVSFGDEKLAANAKAFTDSLMSVKPSSIKGTYIKSVTVASTMGPGIKVDIASL